MLNWEAGKPKELDQSSVRVARHSPGIAATSPNAVSGRRLNRGSFPSLIARRKVVQRSRAKDRAFISLQKGTPPRDPLPAYNASP
jgi:hypothetical protein